MCALFFMIAPSTSTSPIFLRGLILASTIIHHTACILFHISTTDLAPAHHYLNISWPGTLERFVVRVVLSCCDSRPHTHAGRRNTVLGRTLNISFPTLSFASRNHRSWSALYIILHVFVSMWLEQQAKDLNDYAASLSSMVGRFKSGGYGPGLWADLSQLR